jgi:NACalpha-BTF3-like transcription factor
MSTTNLDNLDVTVPESETAITGDNLMQQPVVDEYTVTPGDITFLQNQISITDEQAHSLLLKNKGNYVNAIIDFYQVNYKKEESIGIAQPTITAFTLDNDQKTADSVTGKSIDYNTLKNSTVHKLSKTYFFVNTSPGYSGFTKKKKYCTLQELIDTQVIPDITISLMQSPCSIVIHELVGRSHEILENWSMPSSAIVLCPEQIVTNSNIVEKQLFDKLNKVATQLARHSGIIQESESIIDNAYVIGNVDFN